MSVVSVVSERRSLVAEGPFWDVQQQKLLHVDVDGNALCRLDTKTQQTETLELGGYGSFVIPYKNDPNKVVFSVGEDIKKLTCWTSNTMPTLASAEKGPSPTRFNDGKCDAVGRLWTGTMALESAPAVLEPERGALYSLGKGEGLRKHVEKISISNGIAWTSDDKIMFYIDSYDRKIYVFDFELQKGNICNQRVLVDFNTTPGYFDCGYPDGMAIDTNNHLWVACYDAGRIVKIDPATGRLQHTIKFPASKITSCCFGGVNYDDLYVTSAYNHLSPEERKNQPDAGAVFKVTQLGARGMEANAFSE